MEPEAERDWFPAAVGRFVDAVEAGRAIKTTEFAGAISVLHSNALRDAGKCRYDSGARTEGGETVILLFQCRSKSGEQGIAATVAMDGETVKRI